MGNEMGNNNTSELREEEDNKSTESEGKLKEEGNVVPAPENNGKNSEISAAADDPKEAMHTNGKESLSEETEVHFSTESPESEQKLTEESSIATEFPITNSLPEQSKDNSSPNSSNNVSVMSKDQIGNESLFKKEEEDTTNPSSIAIALTRVLEAEDSAEQVEVLQSEQEELDMSESNTAFAVKETSRGSDNHISDQTKESDDIELAFQEDSRPIDEQFEVENGEAEILKENENDEVQVSVVEETGLLATESQNGDTEFAADDSNSNVNSASNPDEKEELARNGILKAEEMNSSVHQHENFQPDATIAMDLEPVNLTEKISTANDESEEKDSVKETLEIENKDGEVCDESKSEEKLETESLPFDVRSTMESEENKSMEDEQTLEISEKTEVPEFCEAFKPSLSAFLFHPEEKTAMKSEDNQALNNSTSELKLETDTELLDQAALAVFATNTSMEILSETIPENPENGRVFDDQVLDVSTSKVMLESSNELKPDEVQLCESEFADNGVHSKEKSEDNEFKEDEQTLEIDAKSKEPEFPEANEASLSESLLHPEDQQQINIQFIEELSSPLMADSAPVVDLSIGKPEEAEDILVHTPKIWKESNPSDSEDLSAKSCNGSVPEISTGQEKEGEQALEIEAKTKAPEFAQEYKPSFPDSVLCPEGQQQKDDRVFDVSTSEATLEILTETNPSGSKIDSTKSCNGPIPDFSNEDQKETLADENFPDSNGEFKEQTKKVKTNPAIENTEEADSLEFLTETNPSSSVNDSANSHNGMIPDVSNEEQKETRVDENLPGSAGDSEEQTEKVKTLTPAGINNREQETTARFSMESNPDSWTAKPEMRKSPSFGPDLRIEAAKTNESDQTPLLHHNNDTNEQDVNLQRSPTLEKSDSKKSKPLFQPEPKSKDKNRRRSSLFTNCMCCTTVLN